MTDKQRYCVGKKQACRLCGKEYICGFDYNCPHCEIETIILDFIENTEFCSNETMVGVSVGQLRKIKNYYKTKKFEVINNDR